MLHWQSLAPPRGEVDKGWEGRWDLAVGDLERTFGSQAEAYT